MGERETVNQEDPPIFLSFLKHPVVWVVTLVRLLIALSIFIYPLWGLLASMIADWVDSQVLLHGVGISRRQYHLWDKNVDWFAYVVEFSVAASYGLYFPFFLLLFWRFLGQFMFMKTHKRWMFVIFANYFEVAFLWLVAFYPQWIWFIVLIILKEVNELVLHFFLPNHPEWDRGNQTKRFYRWLFRQ